MRVDGYRFYRDVLGSPTRLLAPMVDASEAAWRELSRRHGAQLCYTPMLNAGVLAADRKAGRFDAQVIPGEGAALIAQLCGDDPETLLAAGKIMQERGVAAIDVNLGCPQNIARRGHYGAYLQDEWGLVARIISTLADGLRVPVTAKIRVFPDTERTVAYARMIRDAGAAMLTVHGRTREQRGGATGLPDWAAVRAVREAVQDVPVFGNGGVLFADDVDAMVASTGVDGVMAAEGSLYNPYIFDARCAPMWVPVQEYVSIVSELEGRHGLPTSVSMARGHLFKVYRHAIGPVLGVSHQRALGDARDLETLLAAADEINAVLRETAAADYAAGRTAVDPECAESWPRNHSSVGLDLPPWISRAYVRGPVLPVPGALRGDVDERPAVSSDCPLGDCAAAALDECPGAKRPCVAALSS